MSNFFQILKKTIKISLISLGSIFLTIIILSFTTLPFWMYYYLGATDYTLLKSPEYIIVLGGGGIPSESGLMRTYKVSQEAKKFPQAKIIIALPGKVSDTLSSINLMRHEIISRGIDSSKIILEPKGTNTRMQALQIQNLCGKTSSILLITSPEHMYRSIKTFKKIGFNNIVGNSAFESAIEANLYFNDNELGGNKYILNVGKNTQLRYQFWNHLKYQIIIYREYFAITYYKLKGWI